MPGEWPPNDRQRLMASATAALRRMTRGFDALSDNARLAAHRFVTAEGREWEHPDAILADGEIEAIEARAFGRTLADIDEL